MLSEQTRGTRLAFGLACSLAGALVPYVAYASMSHDKDGDAPFLAAMLVAGGMAFVIFVLCRVVFTSVPVQILTGVAGCYTVFFLAVVVPSSELRAWWPVAVIIGIPTMAPLVAIAWLGSVIAWPARKKSGVVDPGARDKAASDD